jgi:peptidyl-prolyl cis-trans isomerase SurA
MWGCTKAAISANLNILDDDFNPENTGMVGGTMRSSVRLCFIIVNLIVMFGLAQAETLDRIIAVVNGEIILYSELQEQVRQLAKMSPDLNMEDPARRAQIEREILQQMIRDHLSDQEIKRLKIVVTPREIDETIEGIKQENRFTEAQFDYVIQQQGLTRDQFRQQIKKEMERSRLVDRVLKSKTIVTPEQIEAYLKDGQGGFIERRRLAIIVLPYPEGTDKQKVEQIDKLARDIMNRLKGGADFSKLAKEYSKGPAAEDGGDLGYIATDELAPQIEAATRSLKPDEVTDLIKTASGYIILKVVDIQKQKQAAPDSTAREKARRQLLQTEMNRKFQDWVRDLESRSFIQISL